MPNIFVKWIIQRKAHQIKELQRLSSSVITLRTGLEGMILIKKNLETALEQFSGIYESLNGK
jgi:hypothetical protein